MADVRIPSENTQLDPGQEEFFRQWVAANKIPFDPDAKSSDYDMRGFYQGIQQQNPHAQSALDPNDGLTHYPDYWKNPSHQSFSNESRLAPQGAPQWEGDQLQQAGKVLYDDTALTPMQKLLKVMGHQ